MFLTSDFADIATMATIRKCLSRLVEDKSIRRIIDGVFEKPVYSDLLKEYIPADPEKVAYAIAKGFHWTIAPCGDIALNKLGLSTQVPIVWSYISDGPYRKFTWDNITIAYKHRTNRQISHMSETNVEAARFYKNELVPKLNNELEEKLTILHKIANFPEGKVLPARYARHL